MKKLKELNFRDFRTSLTQWNGFFSFLFVENKLNKMKLVHIWIGERQRIVRTVLFLWTYVQLHLSHSYTLYNCRLVEKLRSMPDQLIYQCIKHTITYQNECVFDYCIHCISAFTVCSDQKIVEQSNQHLIATRYSLFDIE